MGIKVLASNRKASHEYTLGNRLEAGLVLQGTEVKSLRMGKCNLADGWVDIENGEAFLMDVHISPYSHGNRENHEEKRPRKLLLNRREINKLEQSVAEKGLTIVPTKLYLKSGKIKVEIATAKGKKLYDKRESKKKKDADRAMERALRGRR